jgi:hypothetical protein
MAQEYMMYFIVIYFIYKSIIHYRRKLKSFWKKKNSSASDFKLSKEKKMFVADNSIVMFESIMKRSNQKNSCVRRRTRDIVVMLEAECVGAYISNQRDGPKPKNQITSTNISSTI